MRIATIVMMQIGAGMMMKTITVMMMWIGINVKRRNDTSVTLLSAAMTLVEDVDVTCQIYKIHGHPANSCWWRYRDDSDDDTDDKVAHIASYQVDTNWYPDLGATHHITGELSKLSTHNKYKGQDLVHTADSSGMEISHIGPSILRTLMTLSNVPLRWDSKCRVL
jgi:hypothetical protein